MNCKHSKTLIEGMDGAQVDSHHEELLAMGTVQRNERIKYGEHLAQLTKIRTEGRSKEMRD